jgi:hypothetical protein
MVMRKSLAVLLSALTLTFGAPIVGIAQAPASTLRGQIVDAGGRGATGMRVELVSDRLVVATTISSTDGHFNFAGVPADNYVVRTTVNGQPTGVRVSVTAGQSAATALLVLPSVAAASPGVILAVVGPALGSIVAATVTIVGNTIVIQSANNSDLNFVATSVAQAQAYLETLNAQVPAPPGTPPLFTFIPTVPASGTQ